MSRTLRGYPAVAKLFRIRAVKSTMVAAFATTGSSPRDRLCAPQVSVFSSSGTSWTSRAFAEVAEFSGQESCFMGFFNWLMQQFGWGTPSRTRSLPDPERAQAQLLKTAPVRTHSNNGNGRPNPGERISRHQLRERRGQPRLVPTRRKALRRQRQIEPVVETVGAAPYRYARYGSQTGRYLDLSLDGNPARLERFNLPAFRTPEELATWIGLPLNKIAWLIHRFTGGRPENVESAHYHFQWLKKRLGGWRLIEAPKSTLKLVQTKILREILDHLPLHRSAHGFAAGRSILTNARPHVGQSILVKFDLSNFYSTVSFARVVAIFRSLGYSREVAIWLGQLTTSVVPWNLKLNEQRPYDISEYYSRHLPQGAPTSPTLANLSAYGLDVRLSGLAKSFKAQYTRYADDLTFSGQVELGHGLRSLIPLVQQIVRQEKFLVNRKKRRVLRSHQRQTVTGVVVNEKPNVARKSFDQLKAILTNCLRQGPSTQNRAQVDDFFAHLQGRIAHVSMLNPARGRQLSDLFTKIDWTR